MPVPSEVYTTNETNDAPPQFLVHPGHLVTEEIHCLVATAVHLYIERKLSDALQLLVSIEARGCGVVGFYFLRGTIREELGEKEASLLEYMQELHFRPRHRRAREAVLGAGKKLLPLLHPEQLVCEWGKGTVERFSLREMGGACRYVSWAEMNLLIRQDPGRLEIAADSVEQPYSAANIALSPRPYSVNSDITPEERFAFLCDDPGAQDHPMYLDTNEAFQLYSVARQSARQNDQKFVFLEIGSWKGGSLLLQLRAALRETDRVRGISVDKKDFSERSEVVAKHKQLTEIMGPSHESLEKVLKALDGDLISLLLIDGDHSLSGAISDIRLYAPLVKSGGIIALHDYLPEPKNAKEAGQLFTLKLVCGEVREACRQTLDRCDGVYSVEFPLLYPVNFQLSMENNHLRTAESQSTFRFYRVERPIIWL